MLDIFMKSFAQWLEARDDSGFAMHDYVPTSSERLAMSLLNPNPKIIGQALRQVAELSDQERQDVLDQIKFKPEIYNKVMNYLLNVRGKTPPVAGIPF